MARVFTITPGLENMGGLKTGGQGSIYKGKRIGEIITAVKILPTPIYSESGDDTNYTAFVNEVAKLKKVNEVSNPYVVKIISSGLTEQGNFPYIEMEYIEGPDLQELLQLPNHPIFTINETLKVAEQLSEAIAHCHTMNVRHGDIKSNNVKLNSNSGNFILLDFGLAVISDEQRRSTLSQLGAIEFMAPEQNTGQMLFQTDIYSFGVVLYELLTGAVPFPQTKNGEAGRDEVRLAHITSVVPDILQKRRAALPRDWLDEKKNLEMEVPKWLIDLVGKCLEKKPEDRFKNGIVLHNHFLQNRVSGATLYNRNNGSVFTGISDPGNLIKNNELVMKQVSNLQMELLKKENELSRMKALLNETEAKRSTVQKNQKMTEVEVSPGKFSWGSFALLVVITFSLAAFLLYPIVTKTFLAGSQNTRDVSKNSSDNPVENIEPVNGIENNQNAGETMEAAETNKAEATNNSVKNEADENIARMDKTRNTKSDTNSGGNVVDSYVKKDDDKSEPLNKPVDNTPVATQNDKTVDQVEGSNPIKNAVTKKYMVVSKAYFYEEPNENNRRNEFISPVDKAVVEALNERYGFVFVVITNPKGQVFKGWLKKIELKLYSIE